MIGKFSEVKDSITYTIDDYKEIIKQYFDYNLNYTGKQFGVEYEFLLHNSDFMIHINTWEDRYIHNICVFNWNGGWNHNRFVLNLELSRCPRYLNKNIETSDYMEHWSWETVDHGKQIYEKIDAKEDVIRQIIKLIVTNEEGHGHLHRDFTIDDILS